jgi:hypothetical protein
MVPRIILHDPARLRPNISLRHRYVRRLFLKANYLQIGATVPGGGPTHAGELAFRFRGPLSRQRSSISWRSAIPDGETWLRRLEGPLLRGARGIEAVQSLAVTWSPRRREWRIEIETMSGSMVSGITAFLPIAVPFDQAEADGVLAMIDALAATAH